jgi:hypothetical protein
MPHQHLPHGKHDDIDISNRIAVEEEKVVVEESVKEEQVLKPVAVVEKPKKITATATVKSG